MFKHTMAVSPEKLLLCFDLNQVLRLVIDHENAMLAIGSALDSDTAHAADPFAAFESGAAPATVRARPIAA